MIALIIVLVVIVGIIAWGVGSYNSFVRSRNVIQESWRQIDVELNRRYDLIPNLVETVRGYAAHERNTLEQITALRNQARQLAASAQGAPTQERAAVEQELTQAVHGLMVSVEAYPDLKSNTNFLELQRELTDTEDRIAAARRFYNANVREYNTKIDSVPTNVIAGFAKFEKATYFEVNDPAVRQAPGVNFGEISQRPAGSTEPQQLPTNTQQPPVQPPSAPPQISTDPFARENQNKGPFQG
ncbi:LemA family protein [Tessaracoccus lacteus]|uniref:LemA family protein n=1 Tax=Tessaracoccus lacteus TaxID=3041766 RepID=A0ABY8PWU0_9ACTN|nr:LemA family protein [Tessaracoccus sp. T21]WGT46857.1 LemA family protein [Tessaracoccus sp. T21]